MGFQNNPHELLAELEELAGTTVPADLRNGLLDPVDAATAALDRHMADEPPHGEALPSVRRAWTTDRNELRRRLLDAKTRAVTRIRANGDRLIGVLEPAHAEAVAEIGSIDEQHPRLHKVKSSAAVNLGNDQLEAWRRRRDLGVAVRDIESFTERHIRRPDIAVTVQATDGARRLYLGEPEAWWSNAPHELLRRFSVANSALIGRPGPPSWADCTALGAVRKLKTWPEITDDAVRYHNLWADNCRQRTPYNQPTIRRVELLAS